MDHSRLKTKHDRGELHPNWHDESRRTQNQTTSRHAHSHWVDGSPRQPPSPLRGPSAPSSHLPYYIPKRVYFSCITHPSLSAPPPSTCFSWFPDCPSVCFPKRAHSPDITGINHSLHRLPQLALPGLTSTNVCGAREMRRCVKGVMGVLLGEKSGERC